MKHQYRLIVIGLFTGAVAASACARLPKEDSSPDQSAAPAGQVSSALEYAAFEVSWPRPTAAQVDTRATSALEIMLGQQLPERPFSRQLADASVKSVSFSAALGSATPKISGRYRHGADELLLNNRALELDVRSATDIGAAAARARFVDTMQQLDDAAVIDESLFDLNQAIVSQTKTVTGSNDTDAQVERVVSYDFLARQSFNGIPFVNSGVRVSVHRSGAISGLRVGGAVAAATLEHGRLRPRAPGYVFRATVDEKYYQERFTKEFPRAQVNSKGLLYMLPLSVNPEAGQKQLLEPEYVFNFANRLGEIVSRRRYVGYSLSNPAAPAHELSPTATPNISGDARPATPPGIPSTPGGSIGD